MATRSTEKENGTANHTMISILEARPGINGVSEGWEPPPSLPPDYPEVSSAYNGDSDDLDTIRFVTLKIPRFQCSEGASEEIDPTIPHITCYWYNDSSQLESPLSGEFPIPKFIRSCEESLVSCTVLTSPSLSWLPTDLLYSLIMEGHIDARIDSFSSESGKFASMALKDVTIYPEHIDVPVPQPYQRSHYQVIGKLPQPLQVSDTSHRIIGQSPASSSSSPASFITASTPGSFLSARSAYISPALISATASMKNDAIREDDKPAPGLSAPLLQLHNDYYTSLHRHAIIQPFDKELNWSGKGQHVTFTDHDTVPLSSISHLGASLSATVDKVTCRRIALARKTMRCNREWTVADALREVYHLQNVRHFHIIQLVGTYLQGRNFSILMYPAADMHLGRFMEDMSDMYMQTNRDPRGFLVSTLGCLTSAVAFIHQRTTKHMDIKPQNILIRDTSKYPFDPDWRVYIADFGLSRSFASQDHSQTDGPTSRTPRYCAPEVYNGEERGRSADIFSLGCVFLEILTTVCWIDLQDLANARRGDSGDGSFHANLESVVEWAHSMLTASSWSLKEAGRDILSDSTLETITKLVTKMVIREPSGRPTAIQLRCSLETILGRTQFFNKTCCRSPPEPYEAYATSVVA